MLPWSLSDSDFYDDKVCVVSVVGRSILSDHVCKASQISSVMAANVFTGPQTEGRTSVVKNGEKYHIEGYYNPSQHVIYLHLLGIYDTNVLVDLCERISNSNDEETSTDFLSEAETEFARALLFIFSVSHIILLHQPGRSFSMTYVRFFRVLDIVRQKLLPRLSDGLRSVPDLPKDWVAAGRPCAPRVLFLFPQCNIASDDKKHSPSQGASKKLQHAMEDQIYRILRKSRVITNISNNSLFAVPANQEFVYLGSDGNLVCDPTSFYLDQLHKFSSVSQKTGKGHSYQASRRAQDFKPFGHNMTDTCDEESLSRSSSPLCDFLRQHIELALTRGFDDNVGRNPVPAVFELPTLELWADASQEAYDFFLSPTPKDTGSKNRFSSLSSMLDVDQRFSESRCSKVQALAEQTYQDGLPAYYTKALHLNKLAQARQVLLQHARGPVCPRYLHELEKHCNDTWKDRKLCEEMSLTGNHCRHAVHRLPDEKETEENKLLSVMPHSSQVKTRAACNCGRKQTEREDPYHYKTANHDFYELMSAACCDTLEKDEFPVFKGIVGNSLSSGNEKSSEVSQSTGRAEKISMDSPCPTDVHHIDHSDDEGSIFHPDDHTSYNPDASQDGPGTEASVALVTGDFDGEDVLISEKMSRQHSSTEYLTGMLHSKSPPGLLPQFSSWSLTSLGKPSSYNPSIGIDQPGFLHGGSFLLPWDVNLKSEKENWPTMGGRKYKPRKSHRSASEGSETSVRLYIGFEYECPRGHRYFLSSQDKIFRAPISGLFKETAYKVLNQPMPLYSPCHCRASKGFIGQLMRVFLVVPDSPLEVRLCCKVQAAPPPSPLYQPTSGGAVLMTPGVWVLRLPYVYMGDEGAYLMPKDPQLFSHCKVLKNIVTTAEVPDK